MEITSISNENPPEIDEIEKILLTVDVNKTVFRGKFDQHVPELAKFSKNGLERKKVDVEYSVAYAGSAAALFAGALTLVIGLIGYMISEEFRVYLPVLAVFPFCAHFLILGKDGDKRNNRLYVLKMALIGK